MFDSGTPERQDANEAEQSEGRHFLQAIASHAYQQHCRQFADNQDALLNWQYREFYETTKSKQDKSFLENIFSDIQCIMESWVEHDKPVYFEVSSDGHVKTCENLAADQLVYQLCIDTNDNEKVQIKFSNEIIKYYYPRQWRQIVLFDELEVNRQKKELRDELYHQAKSACLNDYIVQCIHHFYNQMLKSFKDNYEARNAWQIEQFTRLDDNFFKSSFRSLNTLMRTTNKFPVYFRMSRNGDLTLIGNKTNATCYSLDKDEQDHLFIQEVSDQTTQLTDTYQDQLSQLNLQSDSNTPFVIKMDRVVNPTKQEGDDKPKRVFKPVVSTQITSANIHDYYIAEKNSDSSVSYWHYELVLAEQIFIQHIDIDDLSKILFYEYLNHKKRYSDTFARLTIRKLGVHYYTAGKELLAMIENLLTGINMQGAHGDQTDDVKSHYLKRLPVSIDHLNGSRSRVVTGLQNQVERIINYLGFILALQNNIPKTHMATINIKFLNELKDFLVALGSSNFNWVQLFRTHPKILFESMERLASNIGEELPYYPLDFDEAMTTLGSSLSEQKKELSLTKREIFDWYIKKSNIPEIYGFHLRRMFREIFIVIDVSLMTYALMGAQTFVSQHFNSNALAKLMALQTAATPFMQAALAPYDAINQQYQALFVDNNASIFGFVSTNVQSLLERDDLAFPVKQQKINQEFLKLPNSNAFRCVTEMISQFQCFLECLPQNFSGLFELFFKQQLDEFPGMLQGETREANLELFYLAMVAWYAPKMIRPIEQQYNTTISNLREYLYKLLVEIHDLKALYDNLKTQGYRLDDITWPSVSDLVEKIGFKRELLTNQAPRVEMDRDTNSSDSSSPPSRSVMFMRAAAGEDLNGMGSTLSLSAFAPRIQSKRNNKEVKPLSGLDFANLASATFFDDRSASPGRSGSRSGSYKGKGHKKDGSSGASDASSSPEKKDSGTATLAPPQVPSPRRNSFSGGNK